MAAGSLDIAQLLEALSILYRMGCCLTVLHTRSLIRMNFRSIQTDNHKIVHFGFDSQDIAGKHLDKIFLDNPNSPRDELFHWHFRQAVLVNMRGTGEPTFEQNFPPGSDMIVSILEGPKAAERMEFELFNRMAVEFDLTQ